MAELDRQVALANAGLIDNQTLNASAMFVTAKALVDTAPTTPVAKSILPNAPSVSAKAE
jgi:hypothetical protein